MNHHCSRALRLHFLARCCFVLFFDDPKIQHGIEELPLERNTLSDFLLEKYMYILSIRPFQMVNDKMTKTRKECIKLHQPFFNTHVSYLHQVKKFFWGRNQSFSPHFHRSEEIFWNWSHTAHSKFTCELLRFHTSISMEYVYRYIKWIQKKILDHALSTLIFQQSYLVPNGAVDGATKRMEVTVDG